MNRRYFRCFLIFSPFRRKSENRLHTFCKKSKIWFFLVLWTSTRVDVILVGLIPVESHLIRLRFFFYLKHEAIILKNKTVIIFSIYSISIKLDLIQPKLTQPKWPQPRLKSTTLIFSKISIFSARTLIFLSLTPFS